MDYNGGILPSLHVNVQFRKHSDVVISPTSPTYGMKYVYVTNAI